MDVARFFLRFCKTCACALITVMVVGNSASAAPRDAAALRKLSQAIDLFERGAHVDAEKLLRGTDSACADRCSQAVRAQLWMHIGLVRGTGRKALAPARQAFEYALLLDPQAKLEHELADQPTQRALDAARRKLGLPPLPATPPTAGGLPSPKAGAASPGGGFTPEVPEPLQARFEDALTMLRNGATRDAEKRLAALERACGSGCTALQRAQLWSYIGLCLSRAGEAEQAKRAFARALDLAEAVQLDPAYATETSRGQWRAAQDPRVRAVLLQSDPAGSSSPSQITTKAPATAANASASTRPPAPPAPAGPAQSSESSSVLTQPASAAPSENASSASPATHAPTAATPAPGAAASTPPQATSAIGPTESTARIVGRYGRRYRVEFGGPSKSCDTPCTLMLVPGLTEVNVTGPSSFSTTVTVPEGASKMIVKPRGRGGKITGAVLLMVGGISTILLTYSATAQTAEDAAAQFGAAIGAFALTVTGAVLYYSNRTSRVKVKHASPSSTSTAGGQYSHLRF